MSLERMTALLLALPILAGVGARAQETVVSDAGDRRDLSITIYNNDRAMIRETRRVELARGEQWLELADVAARILAPTAAVRAEGVEVLERNFDFDLLTPDALVRKAVGQMVEIHRPHPTTGEDRVERARILAANDGVVLDIEGRIEILDRMPGRIVFLDLPPKLRARPTLSTLVEAERAGARDLSLAYLAEGLSWSADYVGVLSADETRLDLEGWITLTNRSGTDFADATTQLVAGDVRVVEPELRRRESGVIAFAARADAPAREELLAFQLYTLPRRTTIADNQTRQLALLAAPEARVEKVFRSSFHSFYNAAAPEPANVLLRLKNRADRGLGMPLPAGIMRIYAIDSTGRMQFTGEDRNGHTPVDGEVELVLGKAFDVTIEGTLEERQVLRASRDGDLYEVAQSYLVKNAGSRSAGVELEQNVPGQSFELLSESEAHAALRGDAVRWRIEVPAGGETLLRFRMRVQG